MESIEIPPQNGAPILQGDGTWFAGGKVFDTNAEAWRWLDRRDLEPVSRAEDLADWISRRVD